MRNDYIVVSESNTDLLAGQVVELRDDGWAVAGGIAAVVHGATLTFHQAMTRQNHE